MSDELAVEEPACPASADGRERLLIGRDHLGHWVVRDAKCRCGGLFIDRTEAARFARSECLARLPRPTLVVAVDLLEFDPIFSGLESRHAA